MNELSSGEKTEGIWGGGVTVEAPAKGIKTIAPGRKERYSKIQIKGVQVSYQV